jgi:N-acetylglucosamine kinase-like BadF-type ATPase
MQRIPGDGRSRRAGQIRPLLLGVDGGNTKTVALVADADGTVLGAGSAGQGDIHNALDPEDALVEIIGATAAALSDAGTTGADVTASAFSLAGADWPEDFDMLRHELRERLGLSSEPEVVNDAVGALRCGTDDMVGVSAVIGTYAAVAGRNAHGVLFHLGFWPESTGAHALGSEALAAVWRYMIGLAPPTTLTGRALTRWGCEDEEELLHAFTRIGDALPEGERAGFAEAVLDEAEAGDDIARHIVELVGTRIGDYARVCAERTDQLGAPFPLVLGGGVLKHRSALLRSYVLDRVPDAQPVYAQVDPVVGAVLIAADRLGVRPDPARLQSGPAEAAEAPA